MMDAAATDLIIDDYDTPWKTALVRYFPEFMAFYFPMAYAKIDLTKPYLFLDKELAQVVQDAELGKRIADCLVQVELIHGGQGWIYIHIEIQGQQDPAFAERLFVYNYRISDRYRRPVATFALLTDDSDDWLPTSFGYEVLECRHTIEFPTVKLSRYADKIQSLLEERNPFALVTAAHLLTRQTKGNNEQRYAAKWRLARLLYERDWDKQRIVDLFAIIDWMMRLPLELEQRLLGDINTMERSKAMPYITSVERIGIEKGFLLGLRQGEQQGEQRGEQRGETAIIERLLTRRFGALSETVRARLQSATLEQLDVWADRLLDAASLDEVFGDH